MPDVCFDYWGTHFKRQLSQINTLPAILMGLDKDPHSTSTPPHPTPCLFHQSWLISISDHLNHLLLFPNFNFPFLCFKFTNKKVSLQNPMFSSPIKSESQAALFFSRGDLAVWPQIGHMLSRTDEKLNHLLFVFQKFLYRYCWECIAIFRTPKPV